MLIDSLSPKTKTTKTTKTVIELDSNKSIDIEVDEVDNFIENDTIDTIPNIEQHIIDKKTEKSSLKAFDIASQCNLWIQFNSHYNSLLNEYSDTMINKNIRDIKELSNKQKFKSKIVELTANIKLHKDAIIDIKVTDTFYYIGDTIYCSIIYNKIIDYFLVDYNQFKYIHIIDYNLIREVKSKSILHITDSPDASNCLTCEFYNICDRKLN